MRKIPLTGDFFMRKEVEYKEETYSPIIEKSEVELDERT